MEQKSTLHLLVKRGHRFGSTYQKGLSNHLPMALFALESMGASDSSLEDFYGKYSKRLEPIKPDLEVDVVHIKSHLGKPEHFGSVVKFFSREIESKGISATLNHRLPVLFPGVSGAAFHPLIRLAYALELGEKIEISHALASWVVAYQELEGRSEGHRDGSFQETLEKLRRDFAGYRPKGFGVFRRMKVASEQESFDGFLNSFAITKSSLREIAEICIMLYLSTDDNFTALHAVTSCHATRILQEKVGIDESYLRYFWEAIGSAYVDIGVPVIERQFELGTLPDWKKIEEKATQSENDHTVKFVYSCREEFGAYKNNLYHLAAAKRVGLI